MNNSAIPNKAQWPTAEQVEAWAKLLDERPADLPIKSPEWPRHVADMLRALLIRAETAERDRDDKAQMHRMAESESTTLRKTTQQG